MKSQPFQTAFTSITLALVIFLSIWLIQATQAELTDEARVPLQVKAGATKRADPRPDPFADPVKQFDPEAATQHNRTHASEKVPTVEMQEIRVRRVSEPQLSDNTRDSSQNSQTLELPQINVSAVESQPRYESAKSAEIDRMKAALISESNAREELQSKIDAITREQIELKTTLEREQVNLSLTRQAKDGIAEKLEKSESELVRLNNTTKELRSEAAEMKNSLKHVTNEFDSLRKRFESLQQKPHELTALPFPQTQSQLAPPPPPRDVPPQDQKEFLPPIKKNGESGTPLAPPSDDPRVPLIEAEPLFRESEVTSCDYPPPMVGCDSCTDTQDAPARGLLPKLYRKLKLHDSDCCQTSHAEKKAPVRCTEAETCQPESRRRKGVFYQLCDYVRKHDFVGTDRSQINCSAECDCSSQQHTSRGLIPDITRWIEARRQYGCYEECCCDSY